MYRSIQKYNKNLLSYNSSELKDIFDRKKSDNIVKRSVSDREMLRVIKEEKKFIDIKNFFTNYSNV